MTPVEVLKAAREKIAQGWTQGSYAKDVLGLPDGGKHAVSFCSVGAMWAVERDICKVEVACEAFRRALPRKWISITDWNDAPSRTKKQVLDTFDKAIELAGTQS